MEETSKYLRFLQVLGVGNQFDVVEVNRDLARNNLILGRKAVYASPFDLKYYSQLREVTSCILLSHSPFACLAPLLLVKMEMGSLL